MVAWKTKKLVCLSKLSNSLAEFKVCSPEISSLLKISGYNSGGYNFVISNVHFLLQVGEGGGGLRWTEHMLTFNSEDHQNSCSFNKHASQSPPTIKSCLPPPLPLPPLPPPLPVLLRLPTQPLPLLPHMCHPSPSFQTSPGLLAHLLLAIRNVCLLKVLLFIL